MKKLLLALLLILSAPLAISQGVRYDLPPILSPRGLPVPNASISLCPGTAVISGSTCGTTAQAFTDQSLATPCTSGLPVTPPNLAAPQGVGVCSAIGDSLGNAGFWLSPGSYIYCINSPSATGKCYNLVAPVGSTTGGSPSMPSLNLTGPLTGSGGGTMTGGFKSDAFTLSTHGDRQPIFCNPDFEISSLIPPPCWVQTGSATLSYETSTQAPNKNQSLKVASTAQGAGVLSSNLFSIVGGDTYSITGMAKSDGTGSATVGLDFRDKNNVEVGFLVPSTTSTSWTSLTASGAAPATAVVGRIFLENNASTQPSTVWFDQVSVQKTNFPALNAVLNVAAFSGATADVKIAACFAALPANGGTCDARAFGATTQTIAATVPVASTSGNVALLLDRATVFQPSTAALNMFTISQNGTIDGLTVQVNNQTNYSGTVVQMLSGADGQRSDLRNYLICNGTVIGNSPCHGTDSQVGTGTAISFNAVTGVNASFFNYVEHGTTVGFHDAYLFTSNGTSGSFNASNSNVLTGFGAKNAVNCIHLNSNPGDILGNQISNGECEAATTGTGNALNCILADGTGANLSGNFINSTNCWDYPAATTEVNFSGTTATRNWFNIQDRNLGATPLTDNSTTKTNVVLNIGQNASGNDFPIFRGTGNMQYVATGNGAGIKIVGPDTQWNIQQHINATGDLCFTLSGSAIETCMTNTELYPNTNGALKLGKTTNLYGVPIAGIASFPACSASLEGVMVVANNCNAACTVGGTCTAGGATHCQVYCNGAAYVETGR